jgi:hypothetical protein
VHVRVATLQLQPEPESAVTVRPDGGVSVTVTVPLVGELPTFVVVRVKVTGCPGRSEPLPVRVFAIVRSVPAAGGVTVIGSVAVLSPPFVSPPPDTAAPFTIVPNVPAATTAVTVMSG